MNRLLAAMLAALMLLSLAACGSAPQTAEPSPAPAPPTAYEPSPAPVPEPLADPLEKFLDSMTLAEKGGQLFFVRCPVENAAEDVRAYHLGGYILFGRDTKDKTANELIQAIQPSPCSSAWTRRAAP